MSAKMVTPIYLCSKIDGTATLALFETNSSNIVTITPSSQDARPIWLRR